MALVDTVWYCNAGDQSTTGHYAVAKRVSGAAVVAGQLVRQFTTPTVGNERVFVCIVAGTVAVATDATWVLTRGAKTVDGTATWMECTGQAGLNGDLTNTQTWAAVKAATPAVLGQVIKRSNNASYQICTTAGAMSASEPTFSDTAGTTTTDTTAVWTSLGVVGNFTPGGKAPHARLGNVFVTNWFAAGSTVYVGSNHAESQATLYTIAPANSSGLVGKLLCHNYSGSYPPTASDLTTGATVSTTAAVTLTFSPASNGAFYTYGVTFKAGVGASTATQLFINATTNSLGFYENCSFWLSTTSASAGNNISTGNASGSTQSNWKNCTVKFGNAAHYIYAAGSFTWQNTGQVLESGSAVPTALIGMGGSGVYSNIMLEALDLSQITTNIFATNQSNEGGIRLVKDCKLNAAVTVQQSGVTSSMSLAEQLVRSSA